VFPERIAEPEYPSHYLTRYVSTNGGVRLHRRYITIAPALIGEHVGFDEVADGRWALYFYDYLLGIWTNARGTSMACTCVRSPSDRRPNLLPMSPV
jgi:hypothetical protein